MRMIACCLLTLTMTVCTKQTMPSALFVINMEDVKAYMHAYVAELLLALL